MVVSRTELAAGALRDAGESDPKAAAVTLMRPSINGWTSSSVICRQFLANDCSMSIETRPGPR